jgi:hypothetical protein
MPTASNTKANAEAAVMARKSLHVCSLIRGGACVSASLLERIVGLPSRAADRVLPAAGFQGPQRPLQYL